MALADGGKMSFSFLDERKEKLASFHYLHVEKKRKEKGLNMPSSVREKSLGRCRRGEREMTFIPREGRKGRRESWIPSAK